MSDTHIHACPTLKWVKKNPEKTIYKKDGNSIDILYINLVSVCVVHNTSFSLVKPLRGVFMTPSFRWTNISLSDFFYFCFHHCSGASTLSIPMLILILFQCHIFRFHHCAITFNSIVILLINP